VFGTLAALHNQIVETWQAVQKQPPPTSCAVLDLATVAGLPLMPTLYGLLLAFPVVYCIEGGQTGAARAAAYLSSTPLVRMHLAVALPPALRGLLPEQQWQQQPHRSASLSRYSDEDWEVCAFTLPVGLLTAHVREASHEPLHTTVEHHIKRWADATIATLRASGLTWQSLRVDCQAVDAVCCAVTL
jgi:hypothetical protein